AQGESQMRSQWPVGGAIVLSAYRSHLRVHVARRTASHGRHIHFESDYVRPALCVTLLWNWPADHSCGPSKSAGALSDTYGAIGSFSPSKKARTTEKNESVRSTYAWWPAPER